LFLYEPIHQALADEKYTTPTPIQLQTIPSAVDGKDILGCAQTGTGKTAAFALPILDFIGVEQPKVEPNRPNSLVLAPTRELAIQISDSFRVYGRHMRFSQALVYGGVNQNKQVQSLRKGVDVLIATPGRLLDLMQQGYIDLRNVQIFVLDEADRMLDMGFLPALKRIIAKLPRKRQSLFFSATLPPKSKELSNELLFNPVFVDVAPKSPTVKKIEQQAWLLDRGNKFRALKEILTGDDVERTIVFTRTKRGANQVARKLENAGIRAAAIHGNKSQNARQRALEAFRQKQVTVLVATDVAARGIDIDGVSHEVLPASPFHFAHQTSTMKWKRSRNWSGRSSNWKPLTASPLLLVAKNQNVTTDAPLAVVSRRRDPVPQTREVNKTAINPGAENNPAIGHMPIRTDQLRKAILDPATPLVPIRTRAGTRRKENQMAVELRLQTSPAPKTHPSQTRQKVALGDRLDRSS